ncbi:MAG: PfaD family polyunsaturated fatty acid/polyketide biosynthesis protein [Deltaproteobacteria bacterium]|nr:PfaD family polyunsaturated fatty acid/polyketide biosynthesis protein [Deltaproteobacteria bacterium]MBW2663713.1 PfaD family polyunsaturated fatty acid/polyketide biosynthesis protein [Deltaproteobacteria bacterium]
MISGWWTQGDTPPEAGNQAVKAAIYRVTKPIFLINMNGEPAVGNGGTILIGDLPASKSNGYPLYAYAPPLPPENLGDPHFKKRHNLRYAYIAGAMANGITSVNMVEEMARAGMLGFFGAAGLSLDKIESAINNLQHSIKNLPFGFNLIHSPNDPELEAAVVDLYIKQGISLVSASAYMNITLPLVYFRIKGIHLDPDGNILCPNKIIAKVSRIEVARKFLSPPPEKLLTELVANKMITADEAALAASVPLAEDLTAEADSGGHTDNRPAISLLPTMLALRDEIADKYKFKMPLCVGLGGGIATPYSASAAFAMGAAYILTGSINQSCVEAGTSETVRQMLSEAAQADVTMSPAADMFEMGVKVQVLKRGTMFPFRALKLYELYSMYDNFESIPEKQKTVLERDIFRCRFEENWEQTKSFFLERDPKQVERAEKDPKHKMALVFRSYLGLSSNWAITDDPSRRMDYQIWCGPSMGAFNEWVKGSFLEKFENRKTVTLAMNLLLGASVTTRINWLRNQGVSLPLDVERSCPMELSKIYGCLEV